MSLQIKVDYETWLANALSLRLSPVWVWLVSEDWVGEAATVERLGKRPGRHSGPTIRNFRIVAPKVHRGPCSFLGDATGELRTCQTCNGATRIKLFACPIHGTCTLERDVGVQTCAMCKDWKAKDVPP